MTCIKMLRFTLRNARKILSAFCIFFIFPVSYGAQVWVFPEGRESFYTHIAKAQEPIVIAAIKVHDNLPNSRELIKALQRRKDRETILITESRLSGPERRKGEVLEKTPRSVLQETGALLQSLENGPFTNVHTKVVSGESFLVIGTGMDSSYNSRDFQILFKVDNHNTLVKEVREVFAKIRKGENPFISDTKNLYDISFESFDRDSKELRATRISWGRYTKSHLMYLIEAARKEIWIEQQSLQDSYIVEALRKKCEEGGLVRVIMSKVPFRTQKNLEERINLSQKNLDILAKSGAEIKLTSGEGESHIHAKVLLVDPGNNPMAYIGSSNFYGPVLDPEGRNLNVGIITKEESILDVVIKQLKDDWENLEVSKSL